MPHIYIHFRVSVNKTHADTTIGPFVQVLLTENGAVWATPLGAGERIRKFGIIIDRGHKGTVYSLRVRGQPYVSFHLMTINGSPE